MGTRRKLNWEAIRANVGKPPDPGPEPWFVLRLFPAPEDRTVQVLWQGGEYGLGHVKEGVWRDSRFEKKDPPLGWRPPGPCQEGTDSAWRLKHRLPRPLDYGLQIT